MIVNETRLVGVYVIDMVKIEDERGFFARVWCKKEVEEYKLVSSFVQLNTSFSKKRGTVRGLHYQISPHQEVKVMRCIRGAIFDVIIDLRPDSSTYMQWMGVEVSGENGRMLYVPEGFAHGFQTLVDDTEVIYPVSEYYCPKAERGVRWNDPTFGIRWPETEDVTISDKDRSWPDFRV